MQLSINIPQDEIDQISSRIAKKVTEEVMRQLKENLQKLGVKVEPEVKVGSEVIPLQNKVKIPADVAIDTMSTAEQSETSLLNEDTEQFNAFYDREN